LLPGTTLEVSRRASDPLVAMAVNLPLPADVATGAAPVEIGRNPRAAAR